MNELANIFGYYYKYIKNSPWKGYLMIRMDDIWFYEKGIDHETGETFVHNYTK